MLGLRPNSTFPLLQQRLYPTRAHLKLNPLKLYVGITDYHWFHLHASKQTVEEVNFWRPSSRLGFNVLQWDEPFLFKLHAPNNFIVGGGFFTKFLRLPVSLAWETFGEANGATSLDEVRRRISKYRRQPIEPQDDPQIGCILLEEPFFFEKDDWIPSPPDFKGPTQMGKSYEMLSGTGALLWREVTDRLERAKVKTLGPATGAAKESARFGRPHLVSPRLGQGSFRVLVTDAYEYRCSMTAERTLPVLEAAHIRPYASEGKHELSNGLLLRSDLHKLFDLGYLTVNPDDKKIVVSPRIREEYENGRDYYALHGRELAQPQNTLAFPSLENLNYHAENIFRS
ncbi:MAG: HNH endonuclease [Pyrinomonadaceae bacterium]